MSENNGEPQAIVEQFAALVAKAVESGIGKAHTSAPRLTSTPPDESVAEWLAPRIRETMTHVTALIEDITCAVVSRRLDAAAAADLADALQQQVVALMRRASRLAAIRRLAEGAARDVAVFEPRLNDLTTIRPDRAGPVAETISGLREVEKRYAQLAPDDDQGYSEARDLVRKVHEELRQHVVQLACALPDQAEAVALVLESSRSHICAMLEISEEELRLVTGVECPLTLNGGDEPPLLYHIPVPGGPVTNNQYLLLQALRDAYPGALHKDQMEAICGSYVRDLKQLLNERPIFTHVVHLPGRKGAGGYRIA